MSGIDQKLKNCTKEDLRWIIKRILQLACYSNQDWYLSRALSDLSFEKEKRKLDAADKLAQDAHEKRLEYIRLLEPYRGKLDKEIPKATKIKALQLLKEAEDADEKWSKLMGV